MTNTMAVKIERLAQVIRVLDMDFEPGMVIRWQERPRTPEFPGQWRAAILATTGLWSLTAPHLAGDGKRRRYNNIELLSLVLDDKSVQRVEVAGEWHEVRS